MASVLYASGRAVSKEKSLLGDDRLKRMIDGGETEAFKILSEVGFGAGDAAGEVIDAVSAEETAKLCAFIKEAAPDDKTAKFFLYPNDFKNAEALVKAKYLKTETELSPNGLFDTRDLKDKIFADSYGALPPCMAKALFNADKAFVEGTASGVYINSLFTKALYDELFSLRIKNSFISKILCAKADMINIGIALRTRDFNAAEKQFVHTGKLDKTALKSVCEDDFDKIRERFRFDDYKDEVEAAINGLENGAGLREFEKMSDGYAVKLIKKHRYGNEGDFPFIRYCFYKLADIANVRIILVGLRGGLSAAEITERLREHYER
ncbi:MAG: V-type ATPase subunit [Clostridia bacterium]|nr:V-type ATPase subunit [Clostridia bacterium]